MSVDDAHTRPAGTSDATVEAVGEALEVIEVIEDARGQYCSASKGRSAWPTWPSARRSACCATPVTTSWPTGSRPTWSGATSSRGAGPSRSWRSSRTATTPPSREHERTVRDDPMGGKRDVFEAEGMKQDRRTHGRPGHAATPSDSDVVVTGWPEPPAVGSEANALLGRSTATASPTSAPTSRDEQLREMVGASAVTLGGLLKHLAYMEDLNFIVGPRRSRTCRTPWAAMPAEGRGEAVWRSAADDDAETLYRLWADAVGPVTRRAARGAGRRAAPDATYLIGW